MIFFSSFSCLCQTKEKHNSIVKINLISALDVFSFETIQLSYERKLNRNISVAGEFGYQVYSFQNKFYTYSDTAFKPERGFKANIEFRCYDFLRHLKIVSEGNSFSQKLYCGLNLFYRKNRANAGIQYSPNDSTYLRDCFWLKKKNHGANLLIGIQAVRFQKIVINPYLGVGIMNRKTENFNREYDHTIHEISNENHNILQIGRGNLQENNGWRANFTAGIRIGLLLN